MQVVVQHSTMRGSSKCPPNQPKHLRTGSLHSLPPHHPPQPAPFRAGRQHRREGTQPPQQPIFATARKVVQGQRLHTHLRPQPLQQEQALRRPLSSSRRPLAAVVMGPSAESHLRPALTRHRKEPAERESSRNNQLLRSRVVLVPPPRDNRRRHTSLRPQLHRRCLQHPPPQQQAGKQGQGVTPMWH